MTFDHFGALLTWLRDRHGLLQGQIVAHLPETINQQRYSSFERNKRFPRFDELSVIYQALKDAGVRLTLRDRDLFLRLAREHFASKKTHKAQQGPGEWDEMRRELAVIDKLPGVSSPSEHDRSSRSIPPLRMEISHLIGREEWLNALYDMIAKRQYKWIVLQGPPGVGKTSELHRVANYFQQYIPRHYVILCKLPERDQEAVSADIALEILLSDILQGIEPANAFMPVSKLQAQVKYVLDCVARADRHVLILLDNAEHLLDEQGCLVTSWQSFYKKFVQARHHASLVLASKEWPSHFTAESQWSTQALVPALSRDEGIELLQRLGLHGLPEEQLGRVVEAVKGVPICLEWTARLVKEPLLQADWSAFEEDEGSDAALPDQEKAQRLAYLLEDASLFRGPVAARMAPLLERVLRRLSPDALAALQGLALAGVPLGAPALRMLYHSPLPLQELRDTSLLAAYPKRVQLLPMVAAAIRAHLSSQRQEELEGRLVDALLHWLTTSRTLDNQEMGSIITAVSEIYLKHHRLLDAAQFMLRYGWLSFSLGHARRLAQLALKSVEEVRQQTGGQFDIQQHCGARLLYYFLAPFLGQNINANEHRSDYHFILNAAMAGNITFQPLTEIYLIRHLVAYTISQPSEERFEEAQTLFSPCREHMAPDGSDDPDLQAALHEVSAFLLTRHSDFAEEQGEKQRATAYREQAIQLYQKACDLLADCEQLPALATSLWKKRLAKLSTSFGYHLNLLGRYKEALPILEQSILLKEEGYGDPGSLASSLGEKSQSLAALGQYEEALHYDTLAVDEVERLASAGETLSQQDRWVYLVNRACLYLQLQRVDVAEQLLREAIPHIAETRRNYSVLADQTLKEIKEWRENALSSHYQRDWRWIGPLREAISYDAFWWLAHAGPFSRDEQQQWQSLVMQPASEAVQKQLETIISQSRQRELTEAIEEKREPRLWYPAIPIEEVGYRITRLYRLDADIQRREPNETIRDLYHGKVEEELCFLRLIESAYAKDREHFWEMNQQLHPAPTLEEMQYTLGHVKALIGLGLQREQSREAAEQVVTLLSTQLHLSFDQEECETSQDELGSLAPSSGPRQHISARAAQRFFEAVLHNGGCEGWRVILDATTSGARIEAASHLFILPDRKLTLDECKVLLEHEVLSHIADSVAGERSPLGLLAVGTRNYLPILEGLALYHEMQTAKASGKAFDDSRIWLGALSTGLAAGICTPAQSFFNLYSFLNAFLILFRLLRRPDEDRGTVQRSAHSLAQTLCLRTFRGVPDLEKPGVCYSKDASYLRGVLLIQHEVARDETIIDRLSTGRTALEYLPALERLGIKPALQPLRKLAKGADLDAYILSFEMENQDRQQ